MKPPLGRDAVYHADWPGNGRSNIEQGKGNGWRTPPATPALPAVQVKAIPASGRGRPHSVRLV